jgi:hypothetical protein
MIDPFENIEPDDGSAMMIFTAPLEDSEEDEGST